MFLFFMMMNESSRALARLKFRGSSNGACVCCPGWSKSEPASLRVGEFSEGAEKVVGRLVRLGGLGGERLKRGLETAPAVEVERV